MGARSIRKRLAAFAACAALAALLIPAIALAQDANSANDSGVDFSFTSGQTLQAQDTINYWGDCVWERNGDTITVMPGGIGLGKSGSIEEAPWKTTEYDVSRIEINSDGSEQVQVPSCKGLFEGLTNLESVDLSGLYCADSQMENMLANCEKLFQIDMKELDTSTVTSFKDMFAGCKSLEWVNLSLNETRNARDLSGMFQNCEALSNLDISNFNTSNAERFDNMFAGCKSLESLDVTQFDTQMPNTCKAWHTCLRTAPLSK